MRNFQTAIALSIIYTSSLHKQELESEKLDIDYITDVVCDKTGIKKDVVFMRTRKREIVTARQLIQHFAFEKKVSTLETIGHQTGNYDHATVIHSHKTVNNLCIDKEYKRLYDSILVKLP